jgi:2-polyprenyl-3-methyl-5-hydroxy-6-metoxy-1,4-benzoquinol methylase
LPSKLRFLSQVLRHRIRRQPCFCPYCGPGSSLRMLRRKKIVLDIMQCDTCALIFRWPMDTPEEAHTYYQAAYTPEYPQVRLPDRAELNRLLSTSFADTPLDLDEKIKVLQSLRPSGRVLDYGCSWGYGAYQLQRYGFNVTGFEISKPRAQYARSQIGLQVIDSLSELAALPDGSFDVIFSNHVLEHLPCIRETFELTRRLLTSTGLAFHVLPNFTGTAGRSGLWIMWIGEEHPLAPTVEFFKRTLPQHGFRRLVLGSSPFNGELSSALVGNGSQPSLDGDELLVLAYA